MKNQICHILFFALTAVILFSAAILTYDGLQQVTEPTKAFSTYTVALDEYTSQNLLDTVKFFEEPCYEYCQLERNCDSETSVDVLSKTVVKVKNQAGVYEDIDGGNVKLLHANHSLNLMIEKYTVKRKMVDNAPSFYITVESFNTEMDRFDVSFFDFGDDQTDETLSASQIDLIKSKFASELVRKACADNIRPL